MRLSAPEIRVLASLIEKEAAVPDSYPMTLSALRLACNQTTNRRPVVAYDEGTVESALASLKASGLVRFVFPSHGGRTTRYRHAAAERWDLTPGELLVLAALALRGPQTAAEVRARTERFSPTGSSTPVEVELDRLAARAPEPFAVRLERRPGERDVRWVATFGEPIDASELARLAGEDPAEHAAEPTSSRLAPGSSRPGDSAAAPALAALSERVDELAEVLQGVTRRLDRLERELGMSGDDGLPAGGAAG